MQNGETLAATGGFLGSRARYLRLEYSSRAAKPAFRFRVVLSMGSHYDALGVAEDADLDAVRRAYKAACLAHHPDKQTQQHRQQGGEGGDTVLEPAAASAERKMSAAQAAWAVLGDADARKAYDSARQRVRNRVVTDTLWLDDLRSVGEGNIEDGWLEADCRCGGRYLLSPSDRLGSVDTLPCDTCSLAIRVVVPT
jgi:DnaJ domain